MIWSFERRGESLRCEIRRDPDGESYEFAMTGPDGSEQTHRFADPSEVIAHSVEVMRGLLDEGWRSPTLDAVEH